MKELSATEAARRFSDVLDEVEHKGRSFAIRRKGRVVARIEPAATTPNGARVKKILREHRPDRAWAKELAEVRALLLPQEREWPD